MQQKSKKIQIYKIEHKLSLKLSHKDDKHQSPHKAAKREASRGLVKISANYRSVLMYLISISPFSTWSLKKWCFLLRYLILLWKTEFLAIEMALVLWHMRRTLSKITPKSLMVCTVYRIWEQQLAAATYSTSVVDWVTENYFREDQQTREDPRKWQVLEVLFPSNPQPEKSASENPFDSYHIHITRGLN
jgi:hypothetical protein